MFHFLSLTEVRESALVGKWVPSIARNTVLVLLGTLLLTLASKVSIPLVPVPITFQTMAVFLIAMTFGSRLAIATILCFIAEIALGFPVSAGTEIGLPVLFGPTGGYIFGWLFAAALSGYLVEKGWGQSRAGCFLAQILGSILLYGVGVVVLSQFVGMNAAIDFGLTPFILSDIIKISVLSLLIPRLWKKA
jgi:biotin transport system substrate-specific component